MAAALEALSVLAGRPLHAVEPRTPVRLRAARTCYDHIAGSLGVLLHDRFMSLGWLSNGAGGGHGYDLTAEGTKALVALGIDIEASARCGGGSRSPASTGASGGRIWAERSAPRSCTSR